MADVNSTWEKIQQGVAETEKLIGQKQYNPAMVKARQTLEYMVRCLGERACIVEGDTADIIDQLYEGRWITKTTREHYHRIRVLGDKASKENDSNPSDANDAYHILSQEVYSFANDYTPKRRRPTATNRAAAASQGGASSANRPQRPRPQGGNAPRRKKRKASPAEDILRILIPIICIILLIFIIRAFMGGGSSKKPAETTVPETVTMAETDPAADTSAAETEAETPAETTAAAAAYKTTSTVNVRKEPATDARILVQLEPGTEVTVTGTYDEKWTIINYDGQDAYVATAYLTQQ